jgi:hypothetical protein
MTYGKVGQAASLAGQFLEAKLPVQAYLTLTTECGVGRLHMLGAFNRLVKDMMAHERQTLAWIRATEYTSKLHLHAAIIAAKPIDCA